MATTTTNFGWDIPQSTDLVKDGATAIAALGQDIDTAMVDLKGGTTGQVLAKASGTDLDFSWVAQDDSNAIQNAIVDAKGDLISATAADTPARLAVGTNGQVLTADSTTATGIKWATVSGGGMTLLSTTTLSGASTTVSITPTGYNELQIIVTGVTNGSNGNLFMEMNGNTTAGEYIQQFIGTEGTGYYGGANVGLAGVNAILPAQAGYLGSNSGNIAKFTIPQPNSTIRKVVNCISAFQSSSNLQAAQTTVCSVIQTAALTSVKLFTTVGSFTAGTVLVYGVK